MSPHKPVIDYRTFRFSKLKTDEFRHLKLLLYWPIFLLFFLFVERLSPVDYYYPVSCALDAHIPFCEYFLIPYLFWFIYLIGMHLYTLLYDIEAFRKLMRFIIISYSIGMVSYLLFPTCQELRPLAFERDNPFTRFLYYFYQFDTNTNVCPSLHVVGSAAVWCTSWHIVRFRTPRWQFFFSSVAILICVSTMLLKQHSVIDVVAAIPVCVIAYYFSFKRNNTKKKQGGRQ